MEIQQHIMVCVYIIYTYILSIYNTIYCYWYIILYIIHYYTGVPYASNTIRFAPPSVVQPFSGGFHDGTTPYPDCIQSMLFIVIQYNIIQ